MSEAMTGLAARFYGFASKRISLIKKFHDTVADEILGRISVGTILDIGTGLGDLLEKVASRNQHLRLIGPRYIARYDQDSSEQDPTG